MDVKNTAVVKKVMIDAAKADGEPWELIEFAGEKIYIPVSFEDQYENKIVVEAKDWTSVLPTITINGGDQVNGASGSPVFTGDISVGPAKLSSGAYTAATGADVVEAVEVTYNRPLSTSSKIFTLAYGNSTVKDFSCNTVSVYLRPERGPAKLVFGKSSIAALPGAEYIQNVTVLDQYGTEISASNLPTVTGGDDVQYKMFHKDGTDCSAKISISPTRYAPTADRIPTPEII